MSRVVDRDLEVERRVVLRGVVSLGVTEDIGVFVHLIVFILGIPFWKYRIHSLTILGTVDAGVWLRFDRFTFVSNGLLFRLQFWCSYNRCIRLFIGQNDQ